LNPQITTAALKPPLCANPDPLSQGPGAEMDRSEPDGRAEGPRDAASPSEDFEAVVARLAGQRVELARAERAHQLRMRRDPMYARGVAMHLREVRLWHLRSGTFLSLASARLVGRQRAICAATVGRPTRAGHVRARRSRCARRRPAACARDGDDPPGEHARHRPLSGRAAP
jgi:hypothetical protein